MDSRLGLLPAALYRSSSEDSIDNCEIVNIHPTTDDNSLCSIDECAHIAKFDVSHGKTPSKPFARIFASSEIYHHYFPDQCEEAADALSDSCDDVNVPLGQGPSRNDCAQNFSSAPLLSWVCGAPNESIADRASGYDGADLLMSYSADVGPSLVGSPIADLTRTEDTVFDENVFSETESSTIIPQRSDDEDWEEWIDSETDSDIEVVRMGKNDNTNHTNPTDYRALVSMLMKSPSKPKRDNTPKQNKLPKQNGTTNSSTTRRVKLKSRKALELQRSNRRKRKIGDETERSLTMAIREPLSKVTQGLDPAAYSSIQVYERSVYRITLSETCYGFMEFMPSKPRAHDLVVCFCMKRAQGQAEYVYCQSGKYCNHYVHKFCDDELQYLRTKSQMIEACRNYTCPRCSGVKLSPAMSPVLISSDMAGSQMDQMIPSTKKVVIKPLPRRHQPVPKTASQLFAPSTPKPDRPLHANSRCKAAKGPPPPPQSPAPPVLAPRELGKVISYVDRNDTAVSTITTSDGIAHRLSLSEDFHGYLSIFPSLAKSHCTVRLCFCMKTFAPQAEYLYCRSGKYCNHYVHIHCVPELYYKKLHTYFRNNYVCGACVKETYSRDIAGDLYWSEPKDV